MQLWWTGQNSRRKVESVILMHKLVYDSGCGFMEYIASVLCHALIYYDIQPCPN